MEDEASKRAKMGIGEADVLTQKDVYEWDQRVKWIFTVIEKLTFGTVGPRSKNMTISYLLSINNQLYNDDKYLREFINNNFDDIPSVIISLNLINILEDIGEKIQLDEELEKEIQDKSLPAIQVDTYDLYSNSDDKGTDPIKKAFNDMSQELEKFYKEGYLKYDSVKVQQSKDDKKSEESQQEQQQQQNSSSDQGQKSNEGQGSDGEKPKSEEKIPKNDEPSTGDGKKSTNGEPIASNGQESPDGATTKPLNDGATSEAQATKPFTSGMVTSDGAVTSDGQAPTTKQSSDGAVTSDGQAPTTKQSTSGMVTSDELANRFKAAGEASESNVNKGLAELNKLEAQLKGIEVDQKKVLFGKLIKYSKMCKDNPDMKKKIFQISVLEKVNDNPVATMNSWAARHVGDYANSFGIYTSTIFGTIIPRYFHSINKLLNYFEFHNLGSLFVFIFKRIKDDGLFTISEQEGPKENQIINRLKYAESSIHKFIAKKKYDGIESIRLALIYGYLKYDIQISKVNNMDATDKFYIKMMSIIVSNLKIKNHLLDILKRLYLNNTFIQNYNMDQKDMWYKDFFMDERVIMKKKLKIKHTHTNNLCLINRKKMLIIYSK